jgi:hypothetical protein
MSFHVSAERGDFFTTLSYAALNGSLWAVGAAWATAIREIMIFIIPRNNDNLVVVTELGSASITTVLAAGIAILVMRSWKCGETPAPTPTVPIGRTRR